MQILTADSSVVYDDTSEADEVTTDTTVLMQNIEKNTQHIADGIDHIFVVGLVLIVFLGVWNVFNKWYFGGV